MFTTLHPGRDPHGTWSNTPLLGIRRKLSFATRRGFQIQVPCQSSMFARPDFPYLLTADHVALTCSELGGNV